eukprot:5828592-Prorocentrum_lima.AAC.1
MGVATDRIAANGIVDWQSLEVDLASTQPRIVRMARMGTTTSGAASASPYRLLSAASPKPRAAHPA